MPDDTTPYDEVTDHAYGQAAAATFTTSPTRGGLILSGPCPRCTDPMSFPYVSGVYKSIAPLHSNHPPLDTGKLPMICTCLEEHPGRPSDSSGCGAYWNLTVTTS